jgi:MoaA/NifB/PqqE/SkfB family radical SAM enzyme
MKKIKNKLRDKLKNINFLISRIEIKLKRKKLLSTPMRLTISTSNRCNKECPICGINVYRKHNYKRVVNNLTFSQFIKMKSLWKNAKQVTLQGRIGEPILAPDFIKIVRILKKHCIRLVTSTNGLALTEKLQDELITSKFDLLDISIHAAEKETYTILQGSKFEQIMQNLENLMHKRVESGSGYPRVNIIYALNKLNIDETCKMLDLCIRLGVDRLSLNHYHDYCIKNISLDNDHEKANELIRKIYKYAEKINALSIINKNPPFFHKRSPDENISDVSTELCYSPYTELQMRSAYSNKDTLYIGPCNVMNIFKLNYKIAVEKGIDFKKEIWNNKVFQCLRKLCHTPGANPFCSYCKSSSRNYYKGTNGVLNYKKELHYLSELYSLLKKELGEDFEKEVNSEYLTFLSQEDEELRFEKLTGRIV